MVHGNKYFENMYMSTKHETFRVAKSNVFLYTTHGESVTPKGNARLGQPLAKAEQAPDISPN